MWLHNGFSCTAVIAFIWISTVRLLPVAAEEGDQTIHASRRIGKASVTVFEYQEPYGDVVPEFGERLWRTLLCVNVLDEGAVRPRRVWQNATLGKGFLSARSFVIANAINGRFIVGFCIEHNAVMVAPVVLDGKVETLPDDFQLDAKTGRTNWNNSPLLPIPYDNKSLLPVGLAEIGMKRNDGHFVSLKAASSMERGWRIDGEVHDARDIVETMLPGGIKLMEQNRRPVHRFAIFLDEEGKFVKFEVVK